MPRTRVSAYSIAVRYLDDAQWRLQDQVGDEVYEREGNDLHTRGLYLDLGPWQSHVFRLSVTSQA